MTEGYNRLPEISGLPMNLCSVVGEDTPPILLTGGGESEQDRAAALLLSVCPRGSCSLPPSVNVCMNRRMTDCYVKRN